jgi:hypothetical protein
MHRASLALSGPCISLPLPFPAFRWRVPVTLWIIFPGSVKASYSCAVRTRSAVRGEFMTSPVDGGALSPGALRRSGAIEDHNLLSTVDVTAFPAASFVALAPSTRVSSWRRASRPSSASLLNMSLSHSEADSERCGSCG